ncbi:MAG: hypothetical protein AAB425_01985, partial [Bdellovibrionota bacterium]
TYADRKLRASILADGGGGTGEFQFSVPNQADILSRAQWAFEALKQGVDDSRSSTSDGAVMRRANPLPIAVLVELMPGSRIPFGSGRDGRIALALVVILALILGGSALGLPALIAYRRKSAAAREALATARREDEAKLRVERARFDALEMIHRRCEEAERNILQSSEPAAIARILCDATGNLLGRSTVFLGYDAATLQIKPIHTFGADARVRPVHLSSSARERIRDAEKDNRVINLGDYPALQEQMIAAYDVGHFDAWVVAGRGMFSRYEDAPSVLGVLIVLSPDASSHEKTGSLLRLLRSAGMALESQLWLGKSSSPFRTSAATPGWRDPRA